MTVHNGNPNIDPSEISAKARCVGPEFRSGRRKGA